MKELIKLSKKITKKNIRAILLFEICYRTGTILALLPIFTYLFSGVQKLLGYSYLTTKNIFSYLLHPLTIFLLALGLGIGLLLTLFEICSLFVCFQYASHGVKVSVVDMCVLGFHKMKETVKVQKVWIFLWMILLFPIVNLHLILFLCLNIPIIQFVIEQIYVANSLPYLIYIVIFLLLIGVACVFIIPTFVLERHNIKKGLYIAFLLSKKHGFKTAYYLLVWNIGIIVCLFFLYSVMIFGEVCYVKAFVDSEKAIAQALLLKHKSTFLLSYIAGIFDMVGNMGLIFCLYGVFRRRQEKKDIIRMAFQNSKELLPKKVKRLVCFSFCCIFLLEGYMMAFMIRNGSNLITDVVQPISVTAHRGGATYAPENTIPALEMAIENLSDYAEIDVQESKDGVVFLLHDLNLKRTTGKNEYAYNLPYSEIRTLDAGKYFNQSFEGTYIPTLAEVLELCKGKLKLNIEIKGSDRFEGLVEKVVHLIEEYDFKEQCVITSMNYDYLEKVKELNPDIKTGYIMKVVLGNFSQMKDVDFFSMKHTLISEELVAKAHENGKEIHVWTVNARSTIQEMIAYGVDNIITDNPVLVQQMIAGQEQHTFVSLLRLFFSM